MRWRIQGMPDGTGVDGSVQIDQELDGAMLDVALTPCVVIVPGQPARISYWVLHTRSGTDTRKREPEAPHRHIGVRPPDLPPELWRILLDLAKRELAEHEERGTGPFGLDQIVEKIEAALRTEESTS